MQAMDDRHTIDHRGPMHQTLAVKHRNCSVPCISFNGKHATPHAKQLHTSCLYMTYLLHCTCFGHNSTLHAATHHSPLSCSMVSTCLKPSRAS
jgi:hypothetical protein